MSTEPFFHDDSGMVRFWVAVDAGLIGAMVRKETLRYRYHPQREEGDPLVTYRDHAAEIDAAVRRRAAAGSVEPILLRDADLTARPAAAAGS